MSRDWRTTINWPAFTDQPDHEAVHAGSCFVQDDSRDHVSDSRRFGCIEEGLIEGKAVVSFWPFNHFQLLNVKPTLANA